MSTHKNIDKICAGILIATVLLTVLFMNGEALGLVRAERVMGYEERLFDTSRVHTIAIVMDDWDSFISTCENEEYAPCAVVIDGESYKNIGIRAKGNTSLSSVSQMGSRRYSFKLEFDQYDTGRTYHGLDKLCLNNLIQDNTYMKDFLAYTLMEEFGVDAPLCSYAYITVNGEDWGLYLAVEGVEDSFLSRNYGSNSGELYKPDSLSFGGGRGNGRDFDMNEFISENEQTEQNETDPGSSGMSASSGVSEAPASTDSSLAPDASGGFSFGDFSGFAGGGFPGGDFSGNMPGGMPDGGFSGFAGGEMPEGGSFDFDAGSFDASSVPGGFGGGFSGGFGMGSSDVKLQYVDDDPDSYPNIFDNAKTAVSPADQTRLIKALKTLSGENPADALDTDEVLRYFVVHNFLVNGDSYTGMMIHNYYLYEEDGRLSMIPWDYNLAYGTFSGGDASSSVNSPIDTPVSGGASDRPMLAWIYENETYTEQYHELFREFLDTFDFASIIDETAAMIAEYVEKDPTKFCTYEEFEAGAEALRGFCTLREESVYGQLDGTIPATSSGQSADGSSLIDTSSLDLSAMGTMGGSKGAGGFGGGGERGERGGSFPDPGEKTDGESEENGSTDSGSAKSPYGIRTVSAVTTSGTQSAGSVDTLFGGTMPPGGNGTPPSGFGGSMPEGFDGTMPEGFGGNLPEGFDGTVPDNFDPSSNPFASGRSDTAGEEGGTGSEASGQSGSGSERPSGSRPSFPGGGSSGEGFSFSGSGFGSGSGAGSGNTNAVILLAVSAVVLLAGLLAAWKYRR